MCSRENPECIFCKKKGLFLCKQRPFLWDKIYALFGRKKVEWLAETQICLPSIKVLRLCQTNRLKGILSFQTLINWAEPCPSLQRGNDIPFLQDWRNFLISFHFQCVTTCNIYIIENLYHELVARYSLDIKLIHLRFIILVILWMLWILIQIFSFIKIF